MPSDAIFSSDKGADVPEMTISRYDVESVESLSAVLPPGSPVGVYDLSLAEDVPGTGAVRFVVTGAPPEGIGLEVELQSVSDAPQNGGGYLHLPFPAGQTSARSGGVLPGRYWVAVSPLDWESASWYLASSAQEEVLVAEGSETVVELVVSTGGKLDLKVAADGIPDGEGLFRVEEYHAATEAWHVALLFRAEPGGSPPNSNMEVGVLYRSPAVIPTGPHRFRISAAGFETLDETIDIQPGVNTPWRPRLERSSSALPQRSFPSPGR